MKHAVLIEKRFLANTVSKIKPITGRLFDCFLNIPCTMYQVILKDKAFQKLKILILPAD